MSRKWVLSADPYQRLSPQSGSGGVPVTQGGRPFALGHARHTMANAQGILLTGHKALSMSSASCFQVVLYTLILGWVGTDNIKLAVKYAIGIWLSSGNGGGGDLEQSLTGGAE